MPAAGLVGNQNAMDFGPLVPLLLLALPVLAAGEAYYGDSGLEKNFDWRNGPQA